MEKITEFFKLIYNGGSNTFYIALGGISLLFILIIIVILFKAGKDKKEDIKKIEDNANDNKEINIINEQNANTLSETKVLNDLLMQKEEVLPTKEEILPVKEESLIEKEKIEDAKIDEEDNVYIEKTDETDYNIPVIEINKELNELQTETVNNNELLEESIIKESPIKPELAEVDIGKLDNKENELAEVKLDAILNDDINNTFQIDIPKMKPIDIDNDLIEQNIKEEAEVTTNETKEVKIPAKEEDTHQETITILTNEEIRKRLESMQKAHTKPVPQETNDNQSAPISLDEELENIIKTVGLEDTMIIPNIESEESILGK